MIASAGKTSIAVALLFAAWGRTGAAQTAETVLPLTNLNAPGAIQEITSVLTVMPDVRHVSYDSARNAMVFRGSAGQTALAEWLVQQLDRPDGGPVAGPQMPGVFQYHPPAGHDDGDNAVRVFHVSFTDIVTIEEIVTVMRFCADIDHALAFHAGHAVVIRAAPQRAAMAEWVVQQLEQSARAERKTAAFEYQSPDGGRDALASEVHIVYLTNTGTAQSIRALVSLVRTGAGVPRVFPITALKALVIRAEPKRMVAAENVIAATDKPAAQ
jgi:hypothetical protein